MNINADTSPGATLRFSTCKDHDTQRCVSLSDFLIGHSVLLVGKRAIEGPSYTEVEQEVANVRIAQNGEMDSIRTQYMRFALTMRYVMRGTSRFDTI